LFFVFSDVVVQESKTSAKWCNLPLVLKNISDSVWAKFTQTNGTLNNLALISLNVHTSSSLLYLSLINSLIIMI